MATNKGPLQTKLKPRRVPLLADTATQLEMVGQWQDEDRAKLLLLCNEFGIEDSPDRFYRLALALARKHCVGFRESCPTNKWTDLTGGYLVVEVNRLTADRRRSPGHTVSWATDQIAKRAEWAAFLGGRGEDRGEALRVQYQAFQAKPWSNLMWGLFKDWENVRQLGLEVATRDSFDWHTRLLDALRRPQTHENL